MRLKDIDFTNIQNTLMNAYSESEEIRHTTGLGSFSVKDKEFFDIVEALLNKMGYEIHYTNLLENFEFNGQKLGHLPSLTFYKNQYHKEQGGDIYIYDRYSLKKKRELLIHELIHIKDTLTPTWSTNNRDANNVFMLSIGTLKRIEFITELTAMALMMPITGLQRDLFSCSYKIDKVVNDYRAIETSTVIMWIIMHDYFHAHYALLYRIKDENRQEWLHRIDEYSSADRKFDIANIVLNTSSIAFKSWTTKKPEAGESTIDNKDYQCFCFYEKDMQQPLPSEVSSIEMIVTCDKMIIIGWSQHIYTYIQKLDLKKK
jgi:hypothetical protein